VATDWKDIIVDVDALWHAEEHPVSDSISADLGDRGHISPDIRVRHFLHRPVVLLVGRREDQHILLATGGHQEGQMENVPSRKFTKRKMALFMIGVAVAGAIGGAITGYNMGWDPSPY